MYYDRFLLGLSPIYCLQVGIRNFNVSSRYQVEGQWLIQLENNEFAVFNPAGNLHLNASTKVRISPTKVKL